MSGSFQQFPCVLAAINDGIGRRLHTGVQIYVSVAGEVILDAGHGAANGNNQFDADTISLWRSAGKPVTAAAVLCSLDKSRLALSSRLGTLIPETSDTALSDVTVEQVLTHTSGIPVIETGWPRASWQQIIETICAVKERTDASAYQPQSTWFLLGEILQRLDTHGRPYQSLLEEEVFRPLNMPDVWCGLSDSIVAGASARLPDYWTREKGQLVPSPYSRSPWLSAPSPGGNLRGPVSSLGRFYEMVMRKGRTLNGDQFLSPDSVDQMTSRLRVGKYDETLQHTVDFGLGLIIDSNAYGIATVPYGFGKYCSERTFGHGGSQCAMGFCDPASQLVVCWAANGFCGEGQHQRRNRAINEAIYEDLGLQ